MSSALAVAFEVLSEPGSGYPDPRIKVLAEALIQALETLEFMRTYSPFSARPCILCSYKDGVFLEACALHERIAELEEERAAVQRLIGNAEEIRQDKYKFKVVMARDLEAVLAGSLR